MRCVLNTQFPSGSLFDRKGFGYILMISSEPADSCVLSVFACGKAGKPDWSSSPDPGKRLLGYLRSQPGTMGSPNSQEPGQEPILVAQIL